MTDSFRPDEIVVDPGALRAIRATATESGTPRGRTYGLALEFAAQNRDDFEKFIQRHHDD